MTLNFDIYGKAKAAQGTKSVTVCDGYDGNKYWVKVLYYDTRYDNSPVPSCCKPMSVCKSRESAERMVNRFFKSLTW